MFAAIFYGILLDQVTARICVEYFTIGHEPIFGTEDPTLLGLGWGVLATWWVGLLLGVPLAIAARAGGRPKREVATLIKPIALLMLISAIGALTAGVVGWNLAEQELVEIIGPLARDVPKEKHVPFLADAFAHNGSYAIGFIGGVVMIVRVWRSRRVSPAGTNGRGT